MVIPIFEECDGIFVLGVVFFYPDKFRLFNQQFLTKILNIIQKCFCPELKLKQIPVIVFCKTRGLKFYQSSQIGIISAGYIFRAVNV